MSKTAGAGQPSIDPHGRTMGRRLLDLLFGYDFFISYAWADGGAYAQRLASALDAAGFEVFLDRTRFAAGDHWKTVGSWTLRRTGQLILVGSPASLRSAPVLHELEIFSTTGRRVVPIEFEGSLSAANLPTTVAGFLPPEMLRIPESVAALSSGPSQQVLDAIQRTFVLVRQDRRRMRALASVATLLAMLALCAVAFAFRAQESAWEAVEQRGIAESRLAQARTAISENLVDLGKLELAGGQHGADPAQAIAHGYAANRISPGERVPELVRKALHSVPVWSELNVGDAGISILDQEPSSKDRLAASQDLRLAVLASKDGGRLELMEVDTGQVIATRALAPHESVLAGERVVSNWLLLAGAHGESDSFDAEVIDLQGRDLRRAALKERVRAIACATRAPICVYVTDAGQLTRWSGGRTTAVPLAIASGPLGLFMDPSGELAALFSVKSERLQVIRLNSGEVLDIASGSPATVDELAHGGDRSAMLHFLAGGRLATLQRGEDIELVDLARASRERLPRPDNKLSALGVDVAERAEVFAVRWGTRYGSDSRIEVIRPSIAGRDEAPSLEREIVSAESASAGRLVAFSVAPSGNYLVVARAEGGGNRSIAGWLESYSLTQRDKSWKTHEVMSVRGRHVTRLEHSSGSDRLLVWHGENSGASILRLRVAPPDPRTELPFVQISRRLPSDLATRFAAKALTSSDGQQAFVRFAELDVRRYDLVTGQEKRISLTSDPGELLETHSSLRHTLLCGSNGINLVQNDREERWIPAPEPFSHCSFLGNQVLVRTGSGFGVLDLEADGKLKRLDGLSAETTWAMLSRSAPGTLSLMGLAADGTYFKRSWQWSDAAMLKEQLQARSLVPTPPLFSSEVSKDRQASWWVTDKHVFRVDQVARFRGVLRIFDWKTGLISTVLQPPTQGWPERIERVLGAFSTAEGALTLVFQGGGCPEAKGTGTCIFIATWSGGVGPAHLKAAATTGNGLDLEKVDGGDLALIRMRDGGAIRWVSAGDGRIVHTIEIDRSQEYNTPVPPLPALVQGADGKWRLPSDDALRRVYRRMLLGGLDDSEAVTRVRVPEAISTRTKNLN